MDVATLEGVPLLEGLSDPDKARIADAMKEVSHPVGGVLVAQGDLPTTFILILEGTVTVHRSGVHVTDLGVGDFVGEAGVVTREPRNATVIATTPVRAAVLMGWTLRELLEEVPALAARIEQTRATRAPD
jgi:CRP-like cAMP-binding protein